MMELYIENNETQLWTFGEKPSGEKKPTNKPNCTVLDDVTEKWNGDAPLTESPVMQMHIQS